MDFATLEKLNTHRRNRVAVAVITDLTGGESQIITSETVPSGQLGEAVAAAFQSGKSASVTSENRPYFINVYLPAPRIVIIGAVHIAQALVQMAKLSGFDILVIDPRTAFATPDRFGSAELIADWPEDILPTRPLDRHTAVVALSHDPKIDDFALAEALRTGCFYVGALGSRKTQKSRLDRLQSQGFGDADLARIHGPIGLNIGAASPAEIAVSILAEIIATMRGGEKPLS
ncbi:XdhC family protein [Agrobacterium sp. lyk4-40-TYG-31]|uniref:XdhC family protein n=1 Tax=Agrobacterium sp. lyk4-40-TYG-31 TaxID=3040276 RepID=UPI00254DF4D3|nr:XdhC family protein [Agrobacterium sp. lyk4-40-TYG-31]